MAKSEWALKAAQELRAELGRRRISVRALALHIDLPVATVSRWLAGDSPITVDGLIIISDALGMTLEEVKERAKAAPPVPSAAPLAAVVPLDDQLNYVTKRYHNIADGYTYQDMSPFHVTRTDHPTSHHRSRIRDRYSTISGARCKLAS